MWNGGSTLRDFLLCLKGEPDTMIDNQNVLPDWKICVIMKAKYFTGRSARSAKEATLPLASTPNTACSCLLIVIDTTVNQETWLAVCCKIQQCIFVWNNLYWFNVNTRYFHSTTIFIQLQHGLFLCKTNIYSTSTPKVMFYETNIFIQLQQKIFSFNKTYLCNSSGSRTSINSYSTKLHLPTPLPPLL